MKPGRAKPGATVQLTGQRFGRLFVTRPAPDRITPSGQRKKQWECSCDCGRTSVVSSQNLRRGTTTSCGCFVRDGSSARHALGLDLAGQRFGRLVALRRAPTTYNTGWICECDCGVTKPVRTTLLRSGDARSCGCLSRELTAARNAQEVVTYGGMHRRLRRTRGSAAEHTCFDCSGRARDWSYQGDDPDELVTSDGLPYSLNPARYVPRCKSCHTKYDTSRTRGAA